IPAVPNELNGEFFGLRARGGITVSAKWSNGNVEWVELTPDQPCVINLKVPQCDMREVILNDKVRIDF
ncbi:MAG: hypothetical protein J6L96_02475, partial [Clostridia bacterium]|nr:hypothetical protein [Clostridia bacterium]